MGIFATKKLPLTRNSSQPAPGYFALSEKTGGAKHISEEGLIKLNELKKTVKKEYLTKEMHMALCRGTIAELMNSITEIIQDENEKMETKVLKAIKENSK